MAIWLMSRGRKARAAEAVASYRRALSCKPDYPEAHGNMGNVLLEQGKLEEAVLSYGHGVTRG